MWKEGHHRFVKRIDYVKESDIDIPLTKLYYLSTMLSILNKVTSDSASTAPKPSKRKEVVYDRT